MSLKNKRQLTLTDLGACEQFSCSPNAWFANTHYGQDSLTFRGVSSSRSGSQSDSQRSDGQLLLLLSVSGNHTDAPVSVPIKGGWGFPQLEQRQQVGLCGPISSDVGETEAVFSYMCTKGSYEYKHWPASTGLHSICFTV